MKKPSQIDSAADYTCNMSAVGPSPVERILLCERIERGAGTRSVASSLPGHLIQLTLAGCALHEVEGRRYRLGVSDLMWFHEDEEVRVEVVSAPWVFLTLNFIAPALLPPPYERRAMKVGSRVRRRFEGLLKAWQDAAVPEHVRLLRAHGRVLDLLAELEAGPREAVAGHRDAQLWWDLETWFRRDVAQAVSLGVMEEISRRSRATITRSCSRATGLPPMRRVRQIRMSMARGLLRGSTLQVKQVAGRVGYERVNEFSRDYRKHFGRPPSADRAQPGRGEHPGELER